METLKAAHENWANRPDDQRFTSLHELHAFVAEKRKASAARVLTTRDVEVRPVGEDGKGLAVVGPGGAAALPTHWAFGQLAQRAGAPASYLRTLPSPIAADALNFGLKERAVDEIGVLLRKNGTTELAAVTGPNYGRVWNEQITSALVSRFGDGVGGNWRVPGIFGKRLEQVTKENTTLYASDRDLFVFLADEDRRIEIPNRRDGQPGSLARGFFVWNSEVGAATFGIAGFLFDYVCQNRIVWGVDGYREIRIRHTAGAPHRWIEEVHPAIQQYAQSSTKTLQAAIAAARVGRFGNGEEVQQFLLKRFTKSQATAIAEAHLAAEDRPIESLWDAATAVTEYAKGISYQNERVDLERQAGDILDLAN